MIDSKSEPGEYVWIMVEVDVLCVTTVMVGIVVALVIDVVVFDTFEIEVVFDGIVVVIEVELDGLA
jgi:hypothetical protein